MAGLEVDGPGLLARVDFMAARLDYEAAPVRHRVTRVDRQIEQHLLHLRRVGHGRTDVAIQARFNRDILADQSLQDLVEAVNDGIEVDRPDFQASVSARKPAVAA